MTEIPRYVRITTADGQEREILEADCVRIETDMLDEPGDLPGTRGFKPGKTWLHLRDGSRIELASGAAFPPLKNPPNLFE